MKVRYRNPENDRMYLTVLRLEFAWQWNLDPAAVRVTRDPWGELTVSAVQPGTLELRTIHGRLTL